MLRSFGFEKNLQRTLKELLSRKGKAKKWLSNGKLKKNEILLKKAKIEIIKSRFKKNEFPFDFLSIAHWKGNAFR